MQQGRVAHRQPKQPTERIIESTDWIPRGRRPRGSADSQPSVPRKILELDAARKYRGEQSVLRVKGDILHANRVLAVEMLLAQGVANNNTLAACGEHSYQGTLQIYSLDVAVIVARNQTTIGVLSPEASSASDEIPGVQEMRLEP